LTSDIILNLKKLNKLLKGQTRSDAFRILGVFVFTNMAKLGYTFYPKDWGNSEAVFELNLSERGLYREFIDLAMMNDNKTEVNIKTWCRKFAVDFDEINHIIDKLILLGLVEINDTLLSIPSCENRLKLVRGGRAYS